MELVALAASRAGNRRYPQLNANGGLMKNTDNPYVAFHNDKLRLEALKSRHRWWCLGSVVVAYSPAGLPIIEQLLGLVRYIESALT